MARTVAAEPIRSTLALPTCAATNSPHDAPVKASPLRSRTCAHRLILERLSHPLVRLIIWPPSWNWGAAAKYQAHPPCRFSMPRLSSGAHRWRLKRHSPRARHQIQFEFDKLRRTVRVGLRANAADAGTQAPLQRAERLPFQAVKRISGRVPLGDGRAREALVPVVVMAIGASQIELALSLHEQLASFGDKRLQLRIRFGHNRNAARLLRHERGQRQ